MKAACAREPGRHGEQRCRGGALSGATHTLDQDRVRELEGLRGGVVTVAMGMFAKTVSAAFWTTVLSSLSCKSTIKKISGF